MNHWPIWRTQISSYTRYDTKSSGGCKAAKDAAWIFLLVLDSADYNRGRKITKNSPDCKFVIYGVRHGVCSSLLWTVALKALWHLRADSHDSTRFYEHLALHKKMVRLCKDLLSKTSVEVTDVYLLLLLTCKGDHLVFFMFYKNMCD